MVIHKKKELIRESLKYLNKDNPKYTEADISVYRLKLGNVWFNREKPISRLKIGVGGVLCAVGVVTLPIPCGSWFMIGAGCSLMIDGGLDLWWYYRKFERKIDLILFRGGFR